MLQISKPYSKIASQKQEFSTAIRQIFKNQAHYFQGLQICHDSIINIAIFSEIQLKTQMALQLL